MEWHSVLPPPGIEPWDKKNPTVSKDSYDREFVTAPLTITCPYRPILTFAARVVAPQLSCRCRSHMWSRFIDVRDWRPDLTKEIAGLAW
eukprot:scaffold24238_cov95-Skeletonema_marinoi.AAC.1